MEEHKNSISVDEQKFKRKELVLFIKKLIDTINNLEINISIKKDLITSLTIILQRCILLEEVFRLADVVYKVTKSEDTDIRYKGFLKSAIYKIYSSDNLI